MNKPRGLFCVQFDSNTLSTVSLWLSFKTISQSLQRLQLTHILHPHSLTNTYSSINCVVLKCLYILYTLYGIYLIYKVFVYNEYPISHMMSQKKKLEQNSHKQIQTTFWLKYLKKKHQKYFSYFISITYFITNIFILLTESNALVCFISESLFHYLHQIIFEMKICDYEIYQKLFIKIFLTYKKYYY